ncbi:hypothetical protein roselon_00385 [Roseibacterium elongatum DSM 19469]|uniref:Uncharacterized protein n=1 Tax=Roseicyclus elongatus DSM 19469 TaxID=1294273 RepID=W8SJZ5_9RHOB|nr:hypothetical protein [Roseibacterium elongatum]AHM02830.1 hypothetical protein roselon_00385 [Roseibacterium elongatum DSM 19469]
MVTIIAYFALAGFGWLALFQIALALGTPWGNMAWGGARRVLPPALRLGSLAVAVLAVFGVAVALQAGDIAQMGLPRDVLRPALGAFAILFSVSFVGNALSRSRVERRHGVPLTITLALSSALLFVLL